MIVERCANGWVVRPRPDDYRGVVVMTSQVYVFRAWDEAQAKLYELLGGEPKPE